MSHTRWAMAGVMVAVAAVARVAVKESAAVGLSSTYTKMNENEGVF